MKTKNKIQNYGKWKPMLEILLAGDMLVQVQPPGSLPHNKPPCDGPHPHRYCPIKKKKSK